MRKKTKIIAEIERLALQCELSAEDALFAAVANYVKQEGGIVVVIGDIQILQWPDDGDLTFTVGVRCTGRRPILVTKVSENQH